MKLKIDEIIVKVKIVDEGKLKAIISLEFGDFLVKGFRIRSSEFTDTRGDKLWLMPPSYQGGFKWHPIFFVPDKELWAKLENKIMSEYKNKSQEHYKKKYGIEGDISI